MRIKTTQEMLTLRDMETIVLSHERDIAHKKMLMDYYLGRHHIMGKAERSSGAPNNKLVSNYCEYITNMSTGFFLGQPVAYKTATENDEALNVLLDVFAYNDEQAHNLELAEEASIKGDAYELLYTDEEAQVRFATVPAEEIILVCDASLEERIMYAIRHYRVYDVGGYEYREYVDVYDRRAVAHYEYNSGSMRPVGEPEPHYFDDVPVVEYPNNRQHRGDFEGIISLVDAYNKAQSLTLDDMEDFTDAFLVLMGMSGTSSDDVNDMRRSKVMLLDEGGGAQWLIKNLNDTYIENIKKRLQNDIHKFSNIPDMTDDSFAGNASGVAIKYKLIGLEQVRSRKERGFKQGLQRRIELISGMLRTKGGAGIDFRDVDITFTANIPADTQAQAQMVSQLKGIVSDKTLLSQLSFVADPAAELEELAKQSAGDDYGFGIEGNADGGDENGNETE